MIIGGLHLSTKKVNALSAIYINGIRPEYKYYAIRIMDHLYSEPDIGLSLNQIHEIFDHNLTETVNNTLECLRERLLVEELAVCEHNGEPRFNLSEFGRYKLTQFYNSDTIHF